MKHSLSAALAFSLLWSFGSGCATTRSQSSIHGMVFERSGSPLAFAKVRVSMDPEVLPTGPGQALPPPDAMGLAVTGQGGTFEIKKLVDRAGAEYAIPRDTELRVQVYKARFHPWQQVVSYVQGLRAIDVMLNPDHIRIGRDRAVIDVRPQVEAGSWGGVREGS